MIKYVYIVLSLINGLWMLADGAYAFINGKYIGPENPGPWSNVFTYYNVDPVSISPLFIIIGSLWLIVIALYYLEVKWFLHSGVLAAILALWYFPFGTVISLACLLILYRAKGSL